MLKAQFNTYATTKNPGLVGDGLQALPKNIMGTIHQNPPDCQAASHSNDYFNRDPNHISVPALFHRPVNTNPRLSQQISFFTFPTFSPSLRSTPFILPLYLFLVSLIPFVVVCAPISLINSAFILLAERSSMYLEFSTSDTWHVHLLCR